MIKGESFESALSKVNWIDVGKETTIGAATGLIGVGSAKYIEKATKFLKSPIARKALAFVAETAVDMALSTAADQGFKTSGLEGRLMNQWDIVNCPVIK